MELVELYKSFRDPKLIKGLTKEIALLSQKTIKPIYIMEVCGGHTHSIMKYGITQLLPNNIKFIHGPGCPVCVMPKERIDHAAILAQQENVILVCLGDMIRVPGSKGSLANFRAQGCDIRSVYDPLDVIDIAKQHTDKKIIFFAIGFETSTPMTAVLVEQVIKQNLSNVLFHINHVIVPPAINAVMSENKTLVNSFIGPSHVSVITGAKVYQDIVDKYKMPVVVAGFEPVDIMAAILAIIKQKIADTAKLEIEYNRSVTYEGNILAQQKVEKYFTVRPIFRWRGLGEIPNSALMLRSEFAVLDAETIYAEILPNAVIDDNKACKCGDILRGLSSPVDCKLFNNGCNPQNPIGSCMVSSEGACNAYLRYQGVMTSC